MKKNKKSRTRRKIRLQETTTTTMLRQGGRVRASLDVWWELCSADVDDEGEDVISRIAASVSLTLEAVFEVMLQEVKAKIAE